MWRDMLKISIRFKRIEWIVYKTKTMRPEVFCRTRVSKTFHNCFEKEGLFHLADDHPTARIEMRTLPAAHIVDQIHGLSCAFKRRQKS